MSQRGAGAPSPVEPVLAASGVVKRFPGVVALDHVDLSLRAGEVHCLVGENGAGKSSLIKVLSGVETPDAGQVLLGGAPLPGDPAAARSAGVATIHQEHNLVPFMSVADNVVLGSWSERGGFLPRRAVRERAREALDRVGRSLPLDQLTRTLSPADGQFVEVARALAQRARVLILDEPTAALTEADTERLFDLIRSLRDDGIAVLYVSHRLEEIFELGDFITVLRDGREVGAGPAAELTTDELVRLMVGGEVELYAGSEHDPGGVVLEARGLTRAGVLEDVDLELRAGEICGLAGLAGSGRSELAACLFGADPIDSGELRLDGEPVRLRSPVDAIRLGIGLVPEERKQQALIEALSVRENISLSLLDRIGRYGFLRGQAERDIAEEFVRDLRIRTPAIDTKVGALSGGNQQKVVLARWLARRPAVLILDEPTRGVDVGAKAEIHRLIEQLAGNGVAILMISSDLPELLEISDRVVVLRAGQVRATLAREQATRESVMSYAALA